MRRILKLLTRLYPAAWRNRYAAEYEALLDDATPRPQDAFNVLWEATKMQLTSRSFVKIVIPCTIAGALIAATISFTVPPRYIAQTPFVWCESGIFTDWYTCQSSTEDEAKQTLPRLQDDAHDRNFLAATIQKYDLYPRERAHMPLDTVIDKMQSSIQVRRAMVSSSRAPRAGSMSGFVINFAYPDPHVAQRVDWEMMFQIAAQSVMPGSGTSGLSQSHEAVYVMDPPSLPQKPSGWNRIQKTATGLITGLLCGLILATILGSSRDKAPTNIR